MGARSNGDGSVTMPAQRTLFEELEAAQKYLKDAMVQLYSARATVEQAKEAARREGKPTDRLEVLHSELRTLTGWAWEKHIETIQKMATDEAGSRE